MVQEFLDSQDVIARFKKVRGKRMTHCMASGPLVNARLQGRLFHGLLDDGFPATVDPVTE
jgi:hypothetical protein